MDRVDEVSARLLADANGASVYHATWRDLLPVVAAAGGCDAIITDTPYSERTHGGHDDGTDSANRLVHRGKIRGREQTPQDVAKCIRRPINYGAWKPRDVREFVAAWAPLNRGWWVSVTDHILAPAWEHAFRRAGLYTFSPLSYVAPGSRIRLSGDGPTQWANMVVVARPRSREFAQWGALDGAYILPPGHGGPLPVVGGKPRWLMERLVEDYSRPGDLVVDPCCGAGTTAAAAIRTGRRAIVGDAMQAHAEMAARWITDPQPKCPTASEARQGVLW